MISMTDHAARLADLWRRRSLSTYPSAAAAAPGKGTKPPFDALGEARSRYETAEKHHAEALAALAAWRKAAAGEPRVWPERPYRATQLTAVALAAACLWPGLAVPQGLAVATALLGGAAAVRLADRLGRTGRHLHYRGLAKAPLTVGVVDAAALGGLLLVLVTAGLISGGTLALLLAGLLTAMTAGWLREDPDPDRARLEQALADSATARTEAEQALRAAIETARARLARLADGLGPTAAGE